MSADNREGAQPPSGAPAADAGTPAAPSAAPAAEGENVITSHGEREARAYVAPIEVPKRRQRLKTMDMAKVRISADMKVEVMDARHMPTTKMELPPGGLRPPPPPPQAEIADPTSSPWTASGGIDRSMLPSASLGPAAPAPGSRPAAPQASQDEDEGGRSIGIWIGVVVIAALLGGGAAYLLRGKVSSGSNDAGVSSSAPIAVTVPATPGKIPMPPVTAEPSEPTPAEPSATAEPAPVEEPAAEPATTAPANPGVKPVATSPRKTTTTTKTAPTTTAAPTTTTSAPRRLF